jgi:hypothetical protein
MTSGVYPGYLSRILIFSILDLGSQIPDPTTEPKEEGGGGVLCPTIFCSHKYKIFYFLYLAETLIVLLTQTFVIKPSNIWIWDPGSGIWKKPIPDPGSRVKKGPDPGSGSAILTLTVCTCLPIPS